MVFENSGVLNRVRVQKVQWHVPIGSRVQYPSPPPGQEVIVIIAINNIIIILINIITMIIGSEWG